MNDYQAKLQLREHGKIGAENMIVCPYCFYSWGTEGESNGTPFKKNIFECYECKKEFSVDCEPTGDYWFSTKPLEESRWVVKDSDGEFIYDLHLCHFCGGDTTAFSSNTTKFDVLTFRDRDKAEAVALLVDGSVEEV